MPNASLANEVEDTVTVCGSDPASGRLSIGEPQSTGSGGGTNYPAQFLVTADGGYAFLANRGNNSLARYAIEALSPDGGLLFAANKRSGTVTVFHVDADSGELRSAGEPFASPVAVCALPL